MQPSPYSPSAAEDTEASNPRCICSHNPSLCRHWALCLPSLRLQKLQDLHGKPEFYGLGHLERISSLEWVSFFWLIAGKSMFDCATQCSASRSIILTKSK